MKPGLMDSQAKSVELTNAHAGFCWSTAAGAVVVRSLRGRTQCAWWRLRSREGRRGNLSFIEQRLCGRRSIDPCCGMIEYNVVRYCKV